VSSPTGEIDGTALSIIFLLILIIRFSLHSWVKQAVNTYFQPAQDLLTLDCCNLRMPRYRFLLRLIKVLPDL